MIRVELRFSLRGSDPRLTARRVLIGPVVRVPRFVEQPANRHSALSVAVLRSDPQSSVPAEPWRQPPSIWLPARFADSSPLRPAAVPGVRYPRLWSAGPAESKSESQPDRRFARRIAAFPGPPLIGSQASIVETRRLR